MSVHRPAATEHEQLQLELQPFGSSSSPSWRRQFATATNNNSAVSLPRKKSKVEEEEEEEADEDLFTVPDVEAQPSATTASNSAVNNGNRSSIELAVDGSRHEQSSGKRRRGRNPVDKEYKRLKRLLRNRVSAQQARERKKVYVNDLESRAIELQDSNSKLEEKISTLTNENTMFRKILMNTRPKPDENAELSKKQ